MRNLNVISIRQRLYKQYFMENRIAEILWHGYTESRICDRIRPASLALLILKGEISISLPVAAITRKQECELLKFIKEDKHFCRYYDAIYVLFNTGLRISEFCGLTFSDLEFDQKRIKVDHQLQWTSQMQYVIQEPKTESG